LSPSPLSLPALQKSIEGWFIEITVKEILKLKRELYEIIAFHSGNPVEKVEKDSDRDYWMTSKEAKDYGMIDEILEKSQKIG
jgi:ATP-dependent Clp protease protease subunit